MNSNRSPIIPIQGIVKNYLWGSHTTLAAHRGEPASSDPEAELWFGDSPHGPAHVMNSRLTLDEVTREMGQLPFLAKILAVEHALSLQVHPARSDLASLAEIKRDDNHKPEMVVALTSFEALVGFAPIAEILELVDQLESRKVQQLIGDPLRSGVKLTGVLDQILGVTDSSQILDEVLACSGRLDSLRRTWLQELIALYAPKLDPLALLLCHLIQLAPGESIYLPPRCIHAYLHGTAVEVMANSDNVIRGGLTNKPIDKRNFLALVDERSDLAQPITPKVQDGKRLWSPPIDDFSLIEFYGSIDQRVQISNRAIAFAWQGNASITSYESEATGVVVQADRGAFLAPGLYQVKGEGSLWVVSGKGR